MNLKIFVILLAGIFLMTSCSKEESFERERLNRPNNLGNDIPGGLLVKSVAGIEGAADSMVTLYTYDSNKRIARWFNTWVGESDDAFIESDMRFYRNAEGNVNRLSKTEKIIYEGLVHYADSLDYKLQLNELGQMVYAIRTVYTLLDLPIVDSLVYTYDNNSRITSVVAWRQDTQNDNEIFEFHKAIYGYDSRGNIGTVSFYFKDNINTVAPLQLITMRYDDKLASLNLGNEGLIEGFLMIESNSPNNVTFVDNPEGPDKFSIAYEYNADSRPVKAVKTDMINDEQIYINYYY